MRTYYEASHLSTYLVRESYQGGQVAPAVRR